MNLLRTLIATILSIVAALGMQQAALWAGASVHRAHWLGVAIFALVLTARLTTLARQAGERVEF